MMVIDFFRHGSNAVLALACIALAPFVVTPYAALYVIAGALMFYTSEYIIHRFIFHAPPVQTQWLGAMQRRMHYDHHVDPNRLDLLFLPLWFAAPSIAVTAALAWAIAGPIAVAPITFGIMLAILHYEWTHYIAHIPYVPKTAYGRWLKRYHLKHHYVSEKLWFGVSNPVTDILWRTYREPENFVRSASVKNLFPDR